MQDRVLDTFIQLVKIDSESYQEAAAARFVMDAARGLGLETYMDNAGPEIGGEAGNVYVKLPSTGIEAPPILFCVHLDTVSPGKGVEPLVEGDRVISSGKTILGADCKAGVAALIEMMRLSSEGTFSHGPLELIFTVAEERGLKGVRNLEWDRVEAEHAIVLDGAGRVGEVVNVSPTQENLEFVFTGRAAHAGVEPEKGLNAIYGASWAISIMRLGRIDSETTANIGLIEGGRATNIVPERVVARGEIRSTDPAKLEEQRRVMMKAALEAEASVGVGVEVKMERAYDGFHIDPGDALIQLIKEAGKAMGQKIGVKPSGGGSDANFLNASGIKAVVITMGAMEPHSHKEHIEIKDLQRLVRLSTEICMAAGRLRIE